MPNSNAQLETAACSQNAGPWGIKKGDSFLLYANTMDPKRFETKDAAGQWLARGIAQAAGRSAQSREFFTGCNVELIPTEPDPLTEALAELQRAIDKAKAAADSLPPFPHPAPKCCAEPDFRHLERGYSRQTFVNTEDAEGPIAQTDGWDDYSEEGDFQYIRCTACGKRWSSPEGLEWH